MKKFYMLVYSVFFLYLSIFSINAVNAASLKQAQGSYSIPRDGLIGEWLFDGNTNDTHSSTDSTIPIDGNSEIKIEYRAKGNVIGDDINLALIDLRNSSNSIQLGDTAYAGQGFYSYGIGDFNLAQVGFGGNTNLYKEYRVTINGTSFLAQRGASLATLTETTGARVLGKSVMGYKFGLRLASGGGVPYQGGYFDWVKVYQGGVLIFSDDFTGAINSTVWKGQFGDLTTTGTEVGVGITTYGRISTFSNTETTVTSTNSAVTFTSTDIGYQSQSGVFNGSTSQVNLDVTTYNGLNSLQPISDSSICSWAYLNGYGGGGGGHIFDARGTGNFILDSGTSGFAFYSGTGSTLYSGAPTLSKWYFVCGTRVGTNLSLYLDGKVVTTGTTSGVTTPSSGRIANEFNDAADRHFNGQIQGLRVYNRGLRLEEVQNLYLEGQRQLGRGSYFGSTSLLRGLVSHYDMKGDATDIIGGSNGVAIGTTLTTDRFGDANSSYSFTGTTGKYITASNLLTSANYAVGIWVKLTTNNTYTEVILTNGSSTNMQPIVVDNLGKVHQDYWIGSGSSLVGTTTLLPGVWYYILSTRNGTTGSIYINGVLDASGTITANLYTDPWSIGEQQVYNNYFFNGSLSDLSIWNRGLSADEAKALYEVSSKKYLKSNRNLESAYTPNANTVAYYKLNGNVLDSSSMGYHGSGAGVSFTQGAFGQSATFNGTTSYITLPQSTSFDITTGTWSYWIKLTSLAANSLGVMTCNGRSVFDHWDETTGSGSYAGFAIASGTDGVGKFRLGVCISSGAPGNLTVNVIDTGVYDSNYHLISVTLTGTTTQIFFDGDLKSTKTDHSVVNYSTSPVIYVGANHREYTPYTNSPITGNLDEFIIENRLWSASEIKNYYNKSKYKFFE